MSTQKIRIPEPWEINLREKAIEHCVSQNRLEFLLSLMDEWQKPIEVCECDELRNAILAVGSVLPDHTTEKPSVVYGHPTSEQWVKIFLLAAEGGK